MTQRYSYKDIAKTIDHSILSPAATAAELDAGCRLARELDVASVCLLPYYVKRCAELLDGSNVQPSTTIGFPHGGHATKIKVAEVKEALEDGTTEVDCVINISKARGGDWEYVQREIAALTAAARAGRAKIKIIFENAYLDDATKIRLCEICGESGVDWVKTSTGFASSGATVADVLKFLAAGAAMSGVVFLTRDLPIIVPVALGAMIYFAACLILGAVSIGELNQVRLHLMQVRQPLTYNLSSY